MPRNDPALDLDVLVDLRRELHRHPEVSNEESGTAARIVEFLKEHAAPDDLLEGLGGHGVAATYRGEEAGPTVMVRCELDALPIRESNWIDYRSQNDGVGHKCGHDGHMAMVSGLALLLAERRPARGRVVLLYQPAEETGEGARRVLDDPAFRKIEPDYVFALHNLPGFEAGQVVLRTGVFASASRGLVVKLKGAPAHASHPAAGRNPALAATHIVQALLALPTMHTELHQGAAATPIRIDVGQRAFGTSASRGTVMMTLRAHTEETMEKIAERAERMARALAEAHDLEVDVSWTERFAAVENHAECQQFVADVADELDLDTRTVSRPFPWSEDFGQFTSAHAGTMFGLGSGTDHPGLHNGDYDFPDEILETGTRLFHGIARRMLGA
jgi:amidohydrolase